MNGMNERSIRRWRPSLSKAEQVGFVDHHDHDKGEWSDDHCEDEVHHHDKDEYDGMDMSDGEREMIRFEHELLKAFRIDDRDRFRKLMEGSFNICGIFEIAEGFFELLCENEALNCMIALLEGEVGPPLELGLDPEKGICPLHTAAELKCYRVVELLLRYGAPTNLKSKENQVTRGGLLPLNVALENFWYDEALRGWTPKEPFFKLIILLCRPTMREPLEVCRLLARNTKQLDDVILYYAMEGKLIEMAALLMVAREKVLAGFDGSMHLRQFIVDEDIAMCADERKLMARGQRGKWDSVFKDKKEVMQSAVGLLEVFERAGDCIEAYAQSVRSEITEQEVVEDIMFLLQENGFNFTLEDKNIDVKGLDEYLREINCGVCNRIELEMRGLREKRGDLSSQVKDFGVVVIRSGNFFDVVKNPVPNMSNEIMIPSRRSIYAGTPLFHTDCRVIGHPHCMATSFVEVPKRTSKKSLADLLSTNTYGRFASLIKRGLRCI